MERTLSPFVLALIEENLSRVQELLKDPTTDTTHCLKLGQSALRFALRKQASLALIEILAHSSRTPSAELASCIEEVKQSYYEDPAVARRLVRLMESALHARLGVSSSNIVQATIKAIKRRFLTQAEEMS